MNEQREKVVKASSNEEESRYAQRTMADLRDNLAGTKKAYPAFQPWILSKSSADPTKDGKAIDAKIQDGFSKLDKAYAMVQGDAIPTPPPTWSAENPSPQDLATPFGQLYSTVKAAVDPTAPDSIVFQMNNAAAMLGFPQFK
jgi:iron uptake system component EfeO